MSTFIVKQKVFPHRPLFRHAIVLVLYGLLSFVFVMPLPVFALDDHCDPYLKAPANHPYGYSPRGNRCEGIYIQEVSSTTLSVVSFTEFFEDYDLASAKELLVEWNAPGAENVRLRAQGIRRKLYYRMDTVLPADSANYTWSSNILSALSIRKQDIGVIGWGFYPLGKTEQQIYLPLRIRQQDTPGGSGSYQLVLLPGRELTEVYTSLALIEADGLARSFLQDGKPLKYGYYPAGRGFTIPISSLETSGIYYLEVGATLKGGGSTTEELWFYHPEK